VRISRGRTHRFGKELLEKMEQLLSKNLARVCPDELTPSVAHLDVPQRCGRREVETLIVGLLGCLGDDRQWRELGKKLFAELVRQSASQHEVRERISLDGISPDASKQRLHVNTAVLSRNGLYEVA
jgi:hypothetical protein